MTRAVEELNRRMLRARDAIDRAYANPLDIANLSHTSQPEEHFYGKDFGLRDPFGNNIRIVELATQPNGLPKTLEATRPITAKG